MGVLVLVVGRDDGFTTTLDGVVDCCVFCFYEHSHRGLCAGATVGDQRSDDLNTVRWLFLGTPHAVIFCQGGACGCLDAMQKLSSDRCADVFWQSPIAPALDKNC